MTVAGQRWAHGLFFFPGRGQLAGAPVSDCTQRLHIPTSSQREGRNIAPPTPSFLISTFSSSLPLLDIPFWTFSSSPSPEPLILLLVPPLSKAIRSETRGGWKALGLKVPRRNFCHSYPQGGHPAFASSSFKHHTDSGPGILNLHLGSGTGPVNSPHMIYQVELPCPLLYL